MNKKYVTPKAEVLSLQAESMLCGSAQGVPGRGEGQHSQRRKDDIATDALNGGIWK